MALPSRMIGCSRGSNKATAHTYALRCRQRCASTTDGGSMRFILPVQAPMAMELHHAAATCAADAMPHSGSAAAQTPPPCLPAWPDAAVSCTPWRSATRHASPSRAVRLLLAAYALGHIDMNRVPGAAHIATFRTVRTPSIAQSTCSAVPVVPPRHRKRQTARARGWGAWQAEHALGLSPAAAPPTPPAGAPGSSAWRWHCLAGVPLAAVAPTHYQYAAARSTVAVQQTCELVSGLRLLHKQ